MAKDNLDHQQIVQQNKEQFMSVMQQVMPEFFIVAQMMENIRANPNVLFHTMRHIADIANGTGYGQVHIVIEEGIVRFIKGEHSTRLNEKAIKDDDMLTS